MYFASNQHKSLVVVFCRQETAILQLLQCTSGCFDWFRDNDITCNLIG